ncbi:MAG TPA: type 1 glutamine amidotransferase domain-containing protein [Trebonia sp.]|nr:type 1 glutamine amidotransferase domain-containing protein [Trebonia sp.]
MAKEMSGLRVAFLTSNEGVEQAELTTPWQAVMEAGGMPELVAPQEGQVQAFHHLDQGDTFTVHRRISDVDHREYDALVIPGGVANSDALRLSAAAVSFVHRFFEAGKPAAVICHGPWLLVEADLVRGRTLTSWPSLRSDIRNAGGNWVDAEVKVDKVGPNTLVSSRKPADLPAFCAALTREFTQQVQPA